MARKPPRPFIHHGEPEPTRPRETVLDPADARIPTLYPQKLSPEQLRIKLRDGPIDPYLRGLHRCLERWSVTPGSTMSIPQLAQVHFVGGHRDRPAPLRDRECELVDLAVKGSHPWVRDVVFLYYRTGRDAKDIAEILGSKRRQTTYDKLNMALAYLLGKLEQMGLAGAALDPEA